MKQYRRARASALLSTVIVGVTVASCSWSPRNNDRLAHTSDSIAWEGATGTRGQMLFLQTFDNKAGGWSSGESAFTSNTIWQTDAAGTNWFNWGKTVKLLQLPQYWKTSGPNTLQIQLRTQIFDILTGETAMVAALDTGDATNLCIAANQNGGGIAIINNCKSASDAVSLFAPCGTKGEVCCSGTCDPGLTCQGAGTKSLGTCLQPAGGACTADSDCVAGTSCKAGVCSIPCTIGASCAATAIGECANGTVTACTATTKTCTPRERTSEICDNKDNDCDGRRDEDIASTSCTNSSTDGPTTQGCPVGRVRGATACTNGRTVCQFKRGGDSPDFCTGAGPQCGGAFGESGPPCIPGATAVNGRCGLTVCSPLNCWLPSDVNNSKVVCPPQG